ncbi:conserved hypothetical protein [Hahella chejuensis KCTC 2396]|uniref:DUF5063 domain-containing protein n=1 Tax=Hahella chejuensis (strain KCTC 2396) TaxID=349521 RepID=Q2SLN7_HAHCH|nr:DUF5063 domain-containing protein [Hahella chejuensis]ABC28437.1 conserved hypothetical protein [Hahella chejuensis KCTC 2396]
MKTIEPSSEQTQRFVELAREYCQWSEARPGSAEEEMATAARLLAKLYATILELPFEPAGTDLEFETMTHDAWQKIYQRFGSMPFTQYRDIDDPFDMQSASVNAGDIADDLADIYRDMKDGLSLWDHNHTREAVCYWEESFRIHWGQHAIDALKALHWRRHNC